MVLGTFFLEVGGHFYIVESYFRTEDTVTNTGGRMVFGLQDFSLTPLNSRNYTSSLLHVQLGAASGQDCTCSSIAIIGLLLTPSQLEQADLHHSYTYVLC